MKTVFALLLAVALFTPFAIEANQKGKKLWTDWTEKDAEKVLSNSPWARTQTETDTSELTFSPTASAGSDSGTRSSVVGGQSGGESVTKNRGVQGATNQATNLKYGIRFFSARPVRQAFIRMIQLRQKDLGPDVIDRMKTFAEMPSTESIIIAVTIEGTDKRSLGSVMQLFNSAASGTLKNTTYLERNDGKRLFLEEYAPPGRDGFGARFIFPRLIDQKAFLTPEVNDVRFVAEFGSAVKLNVRFKLADMMLDGELEY